MLYTRCMQLAIREGLKDCNAANFIGKLRQVAAAARTPKKTRLLKEDLVKDLFLTKLHGGGAHTLWFKD